MGRENELWPGGTLGGGGGRGGGGGFCHNKKCPLTALKGKTEEEEEGGGTCTTKSCPFSPPLRKEVPKVISSCLRGRGAHKNISRSKKNMVKEILFTQKENSDV